MRENAVTCHESFHRSLQIPVGDSSDKQKTASVCVRLLILLISMLFTKKCSHCLMLNDTFMKMYKKLSDVSSSRFSVEIFSEGCQRVISNDFDQIFLLRWHFL